MKDKDIIKNVRTALGLKSVEMAYELGLQRGSYTDIEKGRNRLSQQAKIILMIKFGVSEGYLNSEPGPMFDYKKQYEWMRKELNYIEAFINKTEKLKTK